MKLLSFFLARCVKVKLGCSTNSAHRTVEHFEEVMVQIMLGSTHRWRCYISSPISYTQHSVCSHPAASALSHFHSLTFLYRRFKWYRGISFCFEKCADKVTPLPPDSPLHFEVQNHPVRTNNNLDADCSCFWSV